MMQSSKLYMIDKYYIMIILVCHFDPHLRVNKINNPRLRAKNCCNCDRALGVFQYKKGGFNPYQYCTEGIQYYPIYDLVVSNSSFFQAYLG